MVSSRTKQFGDGYMQRSYCQPVGFTCQTDPAQTLSLCSQPGIKCGRRV